MKRNIHKKIIIKNQTVQQKPRQGKIESAPHKWIRGSVSNPNPGLHTFKFSELHNDFHCKDINVVVFCHFYYDDVIDEIFGHLKRMPCNLSSLWISLPCKNPLSPDDKTLSKKYKILKEYPNTNIRIVENKGKDIGGKLVCLKDYLESTEEGENQWLVFCHDKKTKRNNKDVGVTWRKELLNGIFNPLNIKKVLGSPHLRKKAVKMWGARVREGTLNSRIIAVHLGNFEYMKKIASMFGFKSLPYTGAFIGGTMFWVTDDLFRTKFKNININGILSLLEKGDVQEPSYTHAIERLFGILVTDTRGHKIGMI